MTSPKLEGLLQPVLGIVAPLLHLQEGHTKAVACLYEQQSSCPLYDEGCFDFSPLYCKEGLTTPAAAAGAPPPRAARKQQPAAALWSDEPNGLSPSPLLPVQELCTQRACDHLDPAEASLCRCLSTAGDPRTCPGVSHDALTAAAAARRACLPASAEG
jgi:hypothetical protein